MGRIVVIENLTLDGVMQAPGGPEEDTRGGFPHGGWAMPYSDPVVAETMGKGIERTGALLLGRRTYEIFAAYWPHLTEPNPFTDVLNNTQKYVASTTLREPLPWVNSALLRGDTATAVAELRARPGGDIAVLGSGELVRFLLRHRLVDQLMLLIHPLVLGTGRRLFPEGQLARLRLVDSVTTTTGVLIGTYQPAE